MALVNCSECGQMVSDKANVCPKCGTPLKNEGTQVVSNEVETTEQTKSEAVTTSVPTNDCPKVKKNRTWMMVVAIIAVLAVAGGVVWFFLGNGNPSEDYRQGFEFYEKGEYEEAVKYYRKAAEQGLDSALFALGICYAIGEGVPQDDEKAARWILKAAEQGLSDAQFIIGECYAKGKGTPQSYTEAAKWYRKSAEQGDAEAQFKLGACYDKGQGVSQSFAEAVKWYRKAAEQGDANAQFQLGSMYGTGQGVPKDYREALIWIKKAAEQGHKQAIYVMNELY